MRHAVKEGFERVHMVAAVAGGTVIEEYPDDSRVLVCGKVSLAPNVDVYLHVVCESADPVYVEFVTAYVPDEGEWGKPPLRRRGRKK